MQHRHMRGHRPHGFHFLLRLAIVFLIFGALFSTRGHGSRSAYWEGFRDGARTAQTAEPGEAVQSVPPFAGPNDMVRGFGGLGLGEFFMMAFCGVALLGFMGILFAVVRGAGRHAGRRGRHGPWGSGRWCDDGTAKGRAVEDDEIGPEKDPNDYL